MFETINHYLKDIYEKCPEQEYLTAIDEQGTERIFTYGTYISESNAIGKHIASHGIGKGDTSILILPQDAELHFSIIGCVMRGVIPTVLAFPNFKFDPERYKKQITHLVTYLDAKYILTTKELPAAIDTLIQDVVTGHKSTTYAKIEDIDLDKQSDVEFMLDAISEDIAFLQHSSGTTGLQKGVAITHRSAINQIEHYASALDLKDTDSVTSWLPLYHDMGMLACFWLPLLKKMPLIQMTPSYWVVNPQELLNRMHRHKSTFAWLPNFSYAFMAQRIHEDTLDKGLDLSHVRGLVNCSEPVTEKSIMEFLSRYKSYGARPEILQASYAMAENTFAVTQTCVDTKPVIDRVKREEFQKDHIAIQVTGTEDACLSFVSCGKSIDGTKIRITGAGGEILSERKVGEIGVQGDSMMGGYYRRDDLTNDAVRDGWYYTGDIGYVANNELFVIGRQKELIIIGGKNIYPQDVESIISDIDGIHPGRVVAVGIINDELGTEDLCIAAEKSPDTKISEPVLRRTIKQSVMNMLDVTARYVFIVPSRWLQKSTSGKMARVQNRARIIETYLSPGKR